MLAGPRAANLLCMSSSDTPSDEIDTVAYAVSFLQAARRLSGPKWEDNHPLVVPFYMLIGFSLENGFKAFLEGRKTDRSLKWFHSHDLSYLRRLCSERMMFLDPVQIEFVEQLSPMHRQHHFRYPQNAAATVLDQPSTAVRITNAILRCIFRAIGGVSRTAD